MVVVVLVVVVVVAASRGGAWLFACFEAAAIDLRHAPDGLESLKAQLQQTLEVDDFVPSGLPDYQWWRPVCSVADRAPSTVAVVRT